MIRINQIKIKIDINDENWYVDSEKLSLLLTTRAAKILHVDPEKISNLHIVKHSIDARKKPELFDVYTIDVVVCGISEDKLLKKCKDRNVIIVQDKNYDFLSKVLEKCDDISFTKEALIQGIADSNKKVCVIGAGPAGLFCSYELAKAGFKPIIIERGADVDKRHEIVEKFWKSGELSEITNVQFGEGGAGTFSDGKLNTMVKDKEGRAQEALNIFADHGAPERIKYDSKPHIGTDILKDVVKNIRNSIISAGGEVFFESKVTGVVIDKDDRLKGLMVRGNEDFQKKYAKDLDQYEKLEDQPEVFIECDAAVLAIGHSARDTFEMLYEKKVEMQPKPFAVGFRVEHPQALINTSQYGIRDSKVLPAAAYKLTTTTKSGRGVYSFCMCPGGYVVNASSEKGMLAVNGMSYSKRDGKNANSAIIITVDPKDFGSDHILSGVEFQRRLEKKAYDLANGKIPVEYYGDFKEAVLGDGPKALMDHEQVEEGAIEWKSAYFALYDEFTPQMRGQYEFADVHKILPSKLNEAFVEGMENFSNIIKGYNNEKALVSGVESRTSSPVRIMRGEDGESVNVKGLFPCGEGAGYAGGIMSAAMDGIRTAELVTIKLL